MMLIQHRNAKLYKVILLGAGIYHILWSLSIIFFPSYFYVINKTENVSDTDLRFVLGIFNAVLGIAFLSAMANPLRHWRIVFIGFIIKFLVVLSYLNCKNTVATDEHFIYQMIWMHQIIWLPLFAYILYGAYRYQQLLDKELIRMNHQSLDEFLKVYVTNQQNNVIDLSYKQPVLLVFLRHFGCTFCKEFLLNLKEVRKEVEAKGIKIILINMIDEHKAQTILKEYNLDDVEYISDEEQLLYKAFKLERGNISSLFGLKVWIRAFKLLVTKKIINSSSDGTDIFQMPGIFLLKDGAVIKQHTYNSVADNPSQIELITMPTKYIEK